ncbi:hypothetical protein B0H10DRAFT_2064097 [Mycena sp. CBHHK59/15]|nr:hypothetical protein B0H10DRAFT_2064097 [Mycena sp. CBHHK59/15]
MGGILSKKYDRKAETHVVTNFEKARKPIDVFYCICKHKLTDHHCQPYCNPAAFPELIDEDGNWCFNTSICEQTNVLFGGYISIVQDMEVTRTKRTTVNAYEVRTGRQRICTKFEAGDGMRQDSLS